MKVALLFIVCFCPILSRATADECKTLLESRTVYTAAIGLVERNLSQRVTFILRGLYDSLSGSDEAALHKVFSAPANTPTVLERINEKKDATEVEVRISGIGKNVLRTLLYLNTKSALTRAKSWTAWQVPSTSTAKLEPLSPPERISEADKRERFLIPLKSFEFSVRTQNGLRNDKLIFVGDLAHKTRAELLRIPNFGLKSLREIEEVLHDLGLSLEMYDDEWPPREPIHPVRYQVAAENQPTFAISDWSSIEFEDAVEYATILRKVQATFIMTIQNRRTLALMPLEVLTHASDKQLVLAINPFWLGRDKTVDPSWIYRLREGLLHANTINLKETLGPTGEEVLRLAAESETPVRVRVRPGKTDYLVLLPLAGISAL